MCVCFTLLSNWRLEIYDTGKVLLHEAIPKRLTFYQPEDEMLLSDTISGIKRSSSRCSGSRCSMVGTAKV